MEELKHLLFELFGSGDLELEVCSWNSNEEYGNYHTDKFHIDIIIKNSSDALVSVDLNSCFNKTSQSPIHFIFSKNKKFSKRGKKRIQSATNYLLRNEDEAGTYFGRIDEYDDLGEHIRIDFYRNY